MIASFFGVDAFERPWLLALGLAAVAYATWRAVRRPAPAIAWPAFEEAIAAGAHTRDFARALAIAARAAALALLAVAIGGPVREHTAPPAAGAGLDIVLVLDTSDSMQALDAESDGAWRTRLDLARRVVARFAEQRVSEGDRVGLVVFGEHAFTQCPLASDGKLLAAALERVGPGMAGSATAVGDALALAVKRVTAAEAIAPIDPPPSEPDGPESDARFRRSEPKASGPFTRPGRLVVLLTDGRSNAGAIPADVATALARAKGVRVHTVGIGGSGEVAMQRGGGRGLRFERHDLDADTLGAIAASTGGRFFPARSANDLDAVYDAIDALERVPRRPPPRRQRSEHPEPFLAGAALLLAVEIATARGVARRLP